MTLADILKHFNVEIDIAPYGNGHINDTYIVDSSPKYIFQRINTKVFPDPVSLMQNIDLVTNHIRNRTIKEGGNPDKATLTIIYTTDNKPFYTPDGVNYYRVYKFVPDAVTYDQAENPMQLYHAAYSFGKFQYMLSNFPAEKLVDIIPKFHDTRDRVANLKKAIENDVAGRAKSVAKEIEFALSYENIAGVVMNGMEDGSIPVRVTHNDTKLNNVLLDENTGEGVCVIDLDTVMKGSLLFDYGDALRFAASTATEDEIDLDKVEFDLVAFEYFTKGYLEALKGEITDRELELLPFSIKLLTYECGIRFLTDYLNGDTYFKIHRENHNLDRARTQFKLIQSMEKHSKDIDDKLSEIYKSI